MTTNTGTIIIMRMLYLLLWMLCTLTAHAQTQTPDSLVSVRARWCKGDTMRYQYEQAQFQVSHRDTLCTDYSCQTMTFVVCDSTDRGYLLEYVPELTASKSPADTARQALHSQFVGELNRLHVRFRTDRNGTVEHIDNWRQLRDSLQACLGRTLDQTYDAGAGALMPRNRLEALLRMEFATEENLRNSLEELDLLFGLHGIAAPVGQQALHPSADYPTEGTITASYGPYGRQGYARDYSLLIQSRTQVPAAEAKGMADQMMDIVMADDLIGRVNHLLGGSNDDLLLNNTEEYHYFFNGWPCMVMRQQNITYGTAKTIKMKRVEWTRRSWTEPSTSLQQEKNM